MRGRDRSSSRIDSREVFYKVLAILYRYSESLAVIEHPKNIERRSIDLAVRLRDGRRILIKVATDIDDIPRSEIQELASLSSLLDIAPLIVAEEKSGEPLLEGVVYEKGSIRVISPETLENVISGREPVYIKVEKSSFILSIDGPAMRKRRTELNMSLGDLASMLGVSRRTVYEYEKGTMEPSLEKAEILIKVLGEDIARPIDIFAPPASMRETRTRFDTISERMIAENLKSRGYRVTHARRTVIDIAAKKDEREVAIVVEHPSRSRNLLDKVYYLNKLANTVGINEKYVVVESKRSERILKREGYETVKPEELARIVAESDEGNISHRSSGKRKDNPS